VPQGQTGDDPGRDGERDHDEAEHRHIGGPRGPLRPERGADRDAKEDQDGAGRHPGVAGDHDHQVALVVRRPDGGQRRVRVRVRAGCQGGDEDRDERDGEQHQVRRRGRLDVVVRVVGAGAMVVMIHGRGEAGHHASERTRTLVRADLTADPEIAATHGVVTDVERSRWWSPCSWSP
jgi:hypothetical protein